MKKILLLLLFFLFLIFVILCVFLKEKEYGNSNISNEKNDEEITIVDIQEDKELYEENMKSESDMMVEYYNLIEGSVYLSGQLSVLDDYVNITKKINVYTNLGLGIDLDYLEQMVNSLANQGWNRLEYKLYDEYAFIMKSEKIGTIIPLSDEECLEQTEIFLKNSGLSKLFEKEDMEYEIQSVINNGLNESFCHLLYNGERTGGYIRFIFQDRNICEECQAYLYKSDFIGSADIIPLENALKNAFYINEIADTSIDDNDYSIRNIDIKYVNGIPYYRFAGYGKNTRTAITGYSLAINIEMFDDNMDILYEAIKSFRIN